MEYRGYRIINSDMNLKMVLALGGKGAVPIALRGRFVKESDAMHEIDKYIEVKGLTNGKNSTAGRI